MTAMTITKEQLANALTTWERSYRAGETMTAEGSLALSVDEVAKLSTENLWKLLIESGIQFSAPARTEAEIISDCNELANTFGAMRGWVDRPDFKYYEATHPEEIGCWEWAVAAYDHIEGTDVQDILDNLED